jgi:hypothetical protein
MRRPFVLSTPQRLSDDVLPGSWDVRQAGLSGSGLLADVERRLGPDRRPSGSNLPEREVGKPSMRRAAVRQSLRVLTPGRAWKEFFSVRSTLHGSESKLMALTPASRLGSCHPEPRRHPPIDEHPDLDPLRRASQWIPAKPAKI